ncbi:TPA: arabinose-5-phosphate isomerase GutQ [Serratia rubidaea]|uniref:arabinose-5-phosphate isomerase GutQ n=1 Tax=Serratia rubidaea TaxID=61652 RepID=UPI0023B0D4F7|nr:arabinose-5-phosphate isomerase GutQ [Serratia rubidaea]MDK1705747.1 arabinose-5-phosphate isomerase GutQ [Serratia rubidaea]HDJ1439379.1 arabinose-5-phosphate isomerase GutQ [Serratia rubidaea]HDJ1449035.1 arabinose-5-phosphate isomerase GutQ [Serratia rubidaea]HDJ1463177.1 arabinose-5-phosphate isomerase GutQ [Serratia rubidaea]HDJ2771217.1 arabinose-5-phosphate isomerase GutQ [Serratia rubidaea]
MDNASTLLTFARETLEIELAEAQRLLARLDDNFVRACELLLNCHGKAVISGIGKSGHIGKKIAASLASTGTPAFFLHPAEALHGDLGMIGPNDVMIFISYSGRAKELDLILPLLAESRIPVIAITGGKASPLAQAAACVLDISVEREACPMGLAPTSSAVNTLMIGDALAMALMRQRGFNAEDFARSHPGGSLGARLLNRVHHLMRTGDRLPKVQESADVMAAMLELSRTGLGLVAVCDERQKVVGVFTDGDLRRWLVQGNKLEDPLSPAITRPGYRLPEQWRAGEALEALHEQHISAAPVVNVEGELVGALNLHDLHQAGIG